METQNNKINSSKALQFTIFRPIDSVDGAKKKWPRIGVAFQNRDGSFNLILNEAVAPNTRLQLRSYKKGEKA